MNRHRYCLGRWAVCVAVGAGWMASRAAGQSSDALRALQALHDRVADPGKVLSEREAETAAAARAAWKLDGATLSSEDRGRLLRVEVYIALGRGQAQEALERAQQLYKTFPRDAASLEAVYLAACAAGDARLGGKALRKLARVRKSERRQVAQRRRWLRRVGTPAPDVVIHTDGGKDVRVRRRRGRLLLLDFWNTTSAPPDEASRALVGLFEQYGKDHRIEFVGVNADAESRGAAARKFAAERGYVWPQCYEAVARDAPITHKAFHAGRPPWQVLVDAMGYVRAVGDARTPAMQYALRAAVHEARGDAPAVLVCDARGRRPQRASETIEAAPRASDAAAEQKPSNPEAARKLTLARTYLKTGRRTDAKRLFEEIVRDYPGTPEAREAQEYLESIWHP